MFALASTSGEDIGIAATVSVFILAVIWVIAHQWRKIRVAAYNARLKQLMIERGMSAREIKEVLDADGDLETSCERRCD